MDMDYLCSYQNVLIVLLYCFNFLYCIQWENHEDVNFATYVIVCKIIWQIQCKQKKMDTFFKSELSLYMEPGEISCVYLCNKNLSSGAVTLNYMSELKSYIQPWYHSLQRL